jgi:excisionase family DNA binding protein
MELISVTEAAQIMGLSPDHVRLLARKGVIRAKKLGHDWVILDTKYERKRKSKSG